MTGTTICAVDEGELRSAGKEGLSRGSFHGSYLSAAEAAWGDYF